MASSAAGSRVGRQPLPDARPPPGVGIRKKSMHRCPLTLQGHYHVRHDHTVEVAQRVPAPEWLRRRGQRWCCRWC